MVNAERDVEPELGHARPRPRVRDPGRGPGPGGGPQGSGSDERQGEGGRHVRGAAVLHFDGQGLERGFRVGGVQDKRDADEEPGGRVHVGLERDAITGADERVPDVAEGGAVAQDQPWKPDLLAIPRSLRQAALGHLPLYFWFLFCV